MCSRKGTQMETCVVLGEEDYPVLLEELYKLLPRSLMVYYPLMLSHRNLIPKFKYICVDKWPEFDCVLEVENLADDVSPHRVNGFCRREEYSVALHRMICHVLQESPSDILLFGGPKRMVEIISMSRDVDASNISGAGCCGSKKIQDTTTSSVHLAYTNNAYRVSRETLKKTEVPTPFTVSTISEEYMELILSHWEYKDVFSDAREYFTPIATSLESVCILNEKGDLVAWGFEQHYGAIGMIHVLPEYRRKKLGSAVVSLLSEKLLQKHDFVYSAIVADNTASIVMHKNVGYEQCDADPESVFSWFMYEKDKTKQ
ncbi:glycine N-acyltransferase-like protein 3 [Ostrea edulis]|uniref:glycine N-acyltransferase-like protein 3 n=1 Tax=Ostrea edulis TaxID=37623 RepID=UPI00209483E0|nr:glycine N-acyltransferase-like protein 3 [Ostrea edulis]